MLVAEPVAERAIGCKLKPEWISSAENAAPIVIFHHDYTFKRGENRGWGKASISVSDFKFESELLDRSSLSCERQTSRKTSADLERSPARERRNWDNKLRRRLLE